MNLNNLLETLRTHAADSELVFATDQGEINGGYHVTELKRAAVTSIDCAARISDWSEATLQLLDGSGGARMSVGKFTAIVGQSVKHLDGLGDLDVRVEFAKGNAGMRNYDVAVPVNHSGRVVINLSEIRAVCKPGIEVASYVSSGKCCA